MRLSGISHAGVRTQQLARRARLQSAAHGTSAAAPRSSRIDYALAYAMSLGTALCGFFAFRLAKSHLGDAGFAEYALTRRALGYLIPLLSLGLGVTVARSVARRLADQPGDGALDQLRGGALAAVASSAALAGVTLVFPRAASLLCTGLDHRADLAWALVPVAGGLVLAAAAAAYCRGRMWNAASHGIQLASIGVIPIAALLATHNVQSFLLATGIAVCMTSIAAVAVIHWHEARRQGRDGAIEMPTSAASPPRRAWAAARTLLREGAPRTPGDLAFYGLLAAPAIVAARQAGLQRGGEVAYGLAALMLLQQAVAPMSTLLLPEASFLIHTRQVPLLQRRLIRLLAASLTATCLLAAACVMWTEPLIRLHLGACTASQAAIVRGLMIAAVPLRFFMCIRNVLDAGDARPTSPAICVVALGVFGIVAAFVPGSAQSVRGVVIAFFAAVCVLAGVSGWAALGVLRGEGAGDVAARRVGSAPLARRG